MLRYPVLPRYHTQQQDPVTSVIYNQLLRSHEKPSDVKWRKQHLYRYLQLWTQLLIVDGILCHHYSPGPDSELVTVPVLPRALQQDAIYQAHDIYTWLWSSRA